MSTTATQDREFRESIISSSLLEDAIEWIKQNMSIDEVFGEKEGLAWASNYDPEGVFQVSELESWAENNGYIKE